MNIQNKIDLLLSYDPYLLDRDTKKNLLLDIIREQILYHTKNCKKYKDWYIANNFKTPNNIYEYDDIPYLPSNIFKLTKLRSIKNSKKIQSSGTSSSLKSMVFIDKFTSINQAKSLSKILSSLLNGKKQNYFVIDIEPQNNNSHKNISARQAGMTGYLLGSKSTTYLLKLDENNNVICDHEKWNKLIDESTKGKVVIIGYTYMLYEYLLNNKTIKNNNLSQKVNFSKSIKILHFGGWKKLIDRQVSKKILLKRIQENLNINANNVYDIYGFTEQLGTIYVSSGLSGCRVPSYSHVLIRDTNTLKVVADGKSGFLQFISPLTLSYPGFSILNDDLGQIVSRKQNDKGIENLTFEVNPRLYNSEARGCGDTLPENYYI